VTAPADGFVYGPTPLEAADHIEKWEAMRGCQGSSLLPLWPVERQSFAQGDWIDSTYGVSWWRGMTRQDVPRLGVRLVPLPVVPPVPVVVKVEDANDAQALIGRSIDGVKITRVMLGPGWCCPKGSDGYLTREIHYDNGESVTVDPEPPPAPVEPDTVGVVEAARALVALYSPLDFTEDRVRLLWADLVAALAAEGDRR